LRVGARRGIGRSSVVRAAMVLSRRNGAMSDDLAVLMGLVFLDFGVLVLVLAFALFVFDR
jgi:hypothetical protein